MPTFNRQTGHNSVKAEERIVAFDDQLSGSGAVVELEAKIAAHFKMERALCVSSATSGLLAVALALELRNCEFITSPYSFGGSIASWLLLGNKPIFVDITPGSLTLDPEAIYKAVTPKTKAVLAVDIFGHPADMVRLRAIADELGIWYVADCAQSLGAYRDGQPSNCLADAVVISFGSHKALCAGEGGAVVSNSELYHRMIWHTQHPDRQRKMLGLHLHNEFAINGRIHPWAADWANMRFDDSLRSVDAYRDQCFTAIDVINSGGMTETIEFQQRQIRPSFFRLTAAWKDDAASEELEHTLAAANMPARISAAPVELLYRQPAFVAQYRRRSRIASPCLEAEQQAEKRFSIELLQ